MLEVIEDIGRKVEARVHALHGDAISRALSAMYAKTEAALDVAEAMVVDCSYRAGLSFYTASKINAHHLRNAAADQTGESAIVLEARAHGLQKRADDLRAMMYFNVCGVCTACKSRVKAWPKTAVMRGESWTVTFISAPHGTHGPGSVKTEYTNKHGIKFNFHTREQCGVEQWMRDCPTDKQKMIGMLYGGGLDDLDLATHKPNWVTFGNPSPKDSWLKDRYVKDGTWGNQSVLRYMKEKDFGEVPHNVYQGMEIKKFTVDESSCVVDEAIKKVLAERAPQVQAEMERVWDLGIFNDRT